MPKQTRRKIRHTDVTEIDLSQEDQMFYIRYKREGRLIEERAGRKKQGMTSAKANKIKNKPHYKSILMLSSRKVH